VVTWSNAGLTAQPVRCHPQQLCYVHQPPLEESADRHGDAHRRQPREHVRLNCVLTFSYVETLFTGIYSSSGDEFCHQSNLEAKHVANVRHLPLEAAAAVVRQEQLHGGDVAPQRRYVQRRLEVRAGLRAAHSASAAVEAVCCCNCCS
jgi:hypothetical protein